MIQFALGPYGAFQVGNDFVYIGQSEAEPFDVMYVACRYAVELFENLFQVFFFDTDTVVLYRDDDLVSFDGGSYHQLQSHTFPCIFDGVVRAG